jgi:imidazolonepropionase-like amidohydrolase
VKRAHELGVKVICGTDSRWSGCTHGKNAFELRMLVEAGLSPMEAIVAATGGAAAGIGSSDVGTLEAGKYADMIFVKGDPLTDINILETPENIVTVMKGGRIVVNRSKK